MKPINNLIWNDINKIPHHCPKCHTKMKQDKKHIDSWYCPNPKCNFKCN